MVDLNELNQRFHRFNLAMSSVMGGIGVFLYWLMDMDFHIRLSSFVWLVTLVMVTLFYWDRVKVQKWVISIPPMLGIIVYFQMLSELISADLSLWFVSFVGGWIVAGAVFLVVLGHWCLNVVNLPVSYLRKTVSWLVVFLVGRFLWDSFFLLTGNVTINGEMVSLIEFIQSFNGFFLFIALLFGTLLPLVFLLYVVKMISIRSFQVINGLLYVVVICVIIGDLFYKLYFFQFGLFL